MDITANVLHNKRNNQLFIAISRRKLKLKQSNIPTKAKIKGLELF